MASRRGDRGAAAVEFAMVATLLVTLLLGIAEFGYLFFQQGVIAGAAREGARYYAIHHTDATALTDAKTATKVAAPGVGLTDADITITACPVTAPAAPPYPQTTVTVQKSYSPGLTGFFGWIFTSSFKLRGEGVMRCGG